MSVSKNSGRLAPVRAHPCARAASDFDRSRSTAIKRRLRSSVTPLGLLVLLCSGATPSLGQTVAQAENQPGSLGPIVVTAPKPRPAKRIQAEADRAGARTRARTAGRTRATTPKPAP